MNNLDTLPSGEPLTIDSLNAFKPGQLVTSSKLKDVIVGKPVNVNLENDTFEVDGIDKDMLFNITGWTPSVKGAFRMSHNLRTAINQCNFDNKDRISGLEDCDFTSSEKSEREAFIKSEIKKDVERGKKLIMVFSEFVESLRFLSGPFPYTYKVISEPNELERLTDSSTLFIESPNHTGKLFIIFDKDGEVIGLFVIYEDKDKDNLKPNDKKRVFIQVTRWEIADNKIKKRYALSSQQPEPTSDGGRRLSRKYKKSNKRIKSSKRSYRKPKSRRNRRQCK